MEIHLKIAGSLLMILAVLHIFLPNYLKWKQELGALSLINRQIMYVHSFFIALVVFLTGLLCITSSSELISTSLGKRISLGIGLFWFIRLIIQFFGYSSRTWKGKAFETTIHIAATIFWVYLSVVFIYGYFEI